MKNKSLNLKERLAETKTAALKLAKEFADIVNSGKLLVFDLSDYRDPKYSPMASLFWMKHFADELIKRCGIDVLNHQDEAGNYDRFIVINPTEFLKKELKRVELTNLSDLDGRVDSSANGSHTDVLARVENH